MKKYRKGIFAVVYAITNDQVEYIILKRKKHWKGWEFVKGKIEKSENKMDTAKREVFEETGLKILKIKRFGIKSKYKYKKELKDRPGIIGQTFQLFGVEVKKAKIKIDKKEHYLGKWINFKGALKMLSWPNQRRCLGIVDSSLQNQKT